MLQAIFEFQSAICSLTGMDVANASAYDAASACAEAVLMALRQLPEKKEILIAETLHPHYRAVVDQYLKSHGVILKTIPFSNEGTIDLKTLADNLNGNTCALLIQSPNFLGLIEPMSQIDKLVKQHGSLLIQCANPISYGLYPSAKENGADIAVGDCQPFGLPLQFGGPYAGYMACREPLLRQIPGRLVGETLDAHGKRGFVLTLQAREQHIRREKAKSNICTNQALAALASLVAMLWYGKEGIPKLALTNFQRASYLQHELSRLSNVTLLRHAPIFNEFAIRFQAPPAKVQAYFRSHNIEPGLSLESFFSSLKGYFLVAVTETKTKTQLDKYLKVAKDF
jgi:glycine dehydrogenase subunit 1